MLVVLPELIARCRGVADCQLLTRQGGEMRLGCGRSSRRMCVALKAGPAASLHVLCGGVVRRRRSRSRNDRRTPVKLPPAMGVLSSPGVERNRCGEMIGKFGR